MQTEAQRRCEAFDKPSAWRGLEQKYWGVVKDALKGMPVRRIIEVGVDYGYSLFTFALDFPEAEVVGVDPYGTNGCPQEKGHEDAEAWVRSHMPLFPNVSLYTIDGLEADSITGPDSADIVHIDSWHDKEFTKKLFAAWEPKLRPGGVMLFHDMNEPIFPGMLEFWAELPGSKLLIPDHHGLGFWFKPE